MQIVKTIKEIREIIKQQRQLNKSIGLVPTMGALHAGHEVLIKTSVKENAFTVVTIFVNPIQFGPQEDLANYPRDLDGDVQKVTNCGADLVFHPEPAEILGNNRLTYVDLEQLANNLCGAARPGHFRGVCTIVAKFFNVVQADKAYFGKKDIQQLIIIKKMVEDLNFPVTIVPCPIVREEDGLAMSSRNLYLKSQERRDAQILNHSLKQAIQLIDSGEKSAENIITFISEKINSKKTAKIDYVKIVNQSMQNIQTIEDQHIIALAVFIGKTRLIDNHIVGETITWT
ncbi:MAG: pantoate--beta-alanine ligase [Spirochaetes bacterium]|nr:pantoate--beta-alanine ligase [Spirochaetota bacterium]